MTRPSSDSFESSSIQSSNVDKIVVLESLINTRTLKKRCALAECTDWSSRHKNCRIGGLMFNNQRTSNSTQNSLLPGI